MSDAKDQKPASAVASASATGPASASASTSAADANKTSHVEGKPPVGPSSPDPQDLKEKESIAKGEDKTADGDAVAEAGDVDEEDDLSVDSVVIELHACHSSLSSNREKASLLSLIEDPRLTMIDSSTMNPYVAFASMTISKPHHLIPHELTPSSRSTHPPRDLPLDNKRSLLQPQEEVIDMETFQQIMDMDEDDGDDDEDGDKHAFSRGIVWGYFEQAEATFTEMEDAIVAEDLGKLSSLGHFLKGSSAALGIIKVQASCEKMQHYGNKRDEEAGVELDSADALKRIKNLLTSCKKDYRVAKKWMEKLYEEDN
ncbi:hypothetical protein IAT40_005349 [Kwoniella sp. CBS 6097]